MEIIGWWEEFKEDVKEEEICLIIAEIDLLEEVETEDQYKIAKKAVDGLNRNIPFYGYTMSVLKKRIKLIRTRMERAVDYRLGSKIKALRESKKLTLAELSNMTGVSVSYINRLELGDKRDPSYTLIKKLANGFDLTSFELMELDIDTLLKRELDTNFLSNLVRGLDIDLHSIDTAGKSSLINLINIVMSPDWEEKDKIVEVSKIINSIDSFRTSIEHKIS